MIGEILNAVLQECVALMKSQGDNTGTVIFKTDFTSQNIASYKMPLMILDLLDAPDTRQLPGGVTMAEWMFAFNCYNYEPDPAGNSVSGYQPGLINILDTFRTHFSIGSWLTQGMTDIFNTYGFKFTISGIQPADALDQDGLVLGYRIVFDSVAVDETTSQVQYSTATLDTLTENPLS